MTAINTADALYVGGYKVDAVYAGAEKVWPPAPPSSDFDPSSIDGLALWFDASQLSLADGAVVDPWPNQVNTALPGTMYGDTPTQTRPKLRTHVRNGLPVVRFTVSEARLRMTGTGVTTDWTLVYVAQMRNPANFGRVVNGIYPTGGNILFGFWNGYQDVAYDSGFTIPDVKVPVTADWKMYSADGASADAPHGIPSTSRLFSDGVFLGSTSTAAGFGGTLAISGYDPYSSAETCDCDVGEVVMYNRKLSDTERQTVEAYLRKKWFPPLYDSATQAYLTTTGLDASYAPVLNDLVVGLKTKGLWTKMQAIYPFVGGTAALHKWNLKDPRDTDDAYRLTFYDIASSSHSGSLGYRPNGAGDVYAGGHADTHLLPSTMISDINSTHLAFYSLAEVPPGDRCEMGNYNWAGAGARFHIIACYNGNAFYYGQCENGASYCAVPSSTGLFVATRIAASDQAAYRNGVKVSTSDQSPPSSGLPTGTIWIGGIDSYRGYSDLPCGFASIGSGLTTQDNADLYDLVQAFQTALGRQV